MADKLTKADIIENIHLKSDLNKKNIHRVIDAFFDELKNALSDDRVIELRGFGTFEIRTRKGRQHARNPRTGETISVSNHGVTAFRPGRELKEIAWKMRE